MRWIYLRGMGGSCLLVVAGLTYARVPSGSSVLRFPLREQADHLTIGLWLGFGGLVLLTWAWLGLVRQVTGHPGGVRLARLAAVAWTAPLLLAPPLFSGDGWSYVATGYLAGHGYSPYETPPSILSPPLLSGVSALWRDTTSPYGPVPIMWGAAFSRLTADPWALLVANRLLAYVGLGLLAVAVPVLARRAGRDPARVTALAVASPLVVAHGIGGLHNDLVLAGLVTAALAVTRRDRWFWGAVLTGLALSVKLPGAGIVIGVTLMSLVPGASMSERVRRGIRVGVVAVATLLALSAVGDLSLGWVSGLTRTAKEVARLAPTALLGHWATIALKAQGPVGVRLIALLHPERAVEAAGLLLLVAGSLWVLLRHRIRDESAAIAGGGLVLMMATLLSPALHYWYFLWAVPLLCCLRLGPRGELALVGLLVALGLTAVLDPSDHVAWFGPTAVAALVLAPAVGWFAQPWLGDLWGRDAAERSTSGHILGQR